MTCEDLRDSYELYSLGLLDGEEKREIEAHLGRNCTLCQKYLKDALGVNALMLSQVHEVVPPSRLRRRVMASVGMEHAGWEWVAALAAACALIVALWLGVEKRTTDRDLTNARVTLQQTEAERDRLAQAFAFLRQPETRQVNFGQGQPTPPRGNFFLNPRMGVLLIASNLPALPVGKAYE
ncbi:MAG: anti-sigma factor, partial [Limisphaerales bacterium]